MTEREVLRLIRVLEEAYNRPFSDGTIDIYARMLADLPTDATQRAVMRLIASSKWVPTIAEIRAAVAEERAPLPSVEDAYVAARAVARQWCPYTRTATDVLHPAVLEALQTVGIDTMATTDAPLVLAAQFRKAYEAIRDRHAIRASMPAALAPAAPEPRALPRPTGPSADQLQREATMRKLQEQEHIRVTVRRQQARRCLSAAEAALALDAYMSTTGHEIPDVEALAGLLEGADASTVDRVVDAAIWDRCTPVAFVEALTDAGLLGDRA